MEKINNHDAHDGIDAETIDRVIKGCAVRIAVRAKSDEQLKSLKSLDEWLKQFGIAPNQRFLKDDSVELSFWTSDKIMLNVRMLVVDTVQNSGLTFVKPDE